MTEALAAINKVIGIYSGVDAKVQDLWRTDTSTQNFIKVARQPGFAINNRNLQILDSQRRTIIPPYLPLQMLITRRPKGLRALGSLRDALQAAGMTQSGFERLAVAAGATFAATSLPEWDNPMFNFWFVVARLVRLANSGTNVLKNATGLATFRFRANASDPLSTPMQWSLTPNVGVPVASIDARKLFPF